MDSISLGSLVIAVLVGKEIALQAEVGKRVVQAPVLLQRWFSYKMLYE